MALSKKELKLKQRMEEHGYTLQLIQDGYLDTPYLQRIYADPTLYDFTFGNLGNKRLVIGAIVKNADNNDVSCFTKAQIVQHEGYLDIDEMGKIAMDWFSGLEEAAGRTPEFFIFMKCGEDDIPFWRKLMEEYCLLRARYLTMSHTQQLIPLLSKKVYEDYLAKCPTIKRFLRMSTTQERMKAVSGDITRLKDKIYG